MHNSHLEFEKDIISMTAECRGVECAILAGLFGLAFRRKSLGHDHLCRHILPLTICLGSLPSGVAIADLMISTISSIFLLTMTVRRLSCESTYNLW